MFANVTPASVEPVADGGVKVTTSSGIEVDFQEN